MSETMTFTAAFREGVREEMARDGSVFVMGTDLWERGGHWAQIKGLGAEFGHERVRDTPISEAAMVAAGVGAALKGTRPIVDLNFIDFALGAMDEIINQAAKIRYMWGRPVPLVIRGTSGVALAGAQHNNSLEMMFAGTPGLAVVSPSNAWDAKGLIKAALRGEDPVIFLMHKKLTGVRGVVGTDQEITPIGLAHRAREGSDLTLIGHGYATVTALKAAEELASRGIECDVIDLRTLSPLDGESVVESVRRTGRALIVDEAPAFGSIGNQVAAIIQSEAFWHLDAPVRVVAAPLSPIPHSPVLVDAMVPSSATVVEQALDLLGQ